MDVSRDRVQLVKYCGHHWNVAFIGYQCVGPFGIEHYFRKGLQVLYKAHYLQLHK